MVSFEFPKNAHVLISVYFFLSCFWEIEFKYYYIVDSLKTDESGGIANNSIEMTVFVDEW